GGEGGGGLGIEGGKEAGGELQNKGIMVTGGSGFLGGHVLARLRQVGCRHIIAPLSADYDLTREPDVLRLLQKERPQVVLHLAAPVGGIGANRKFPGTFLSPKLTMGTPLIEASRQLGIEKFVMVGTICCIRSSRQCRSRNRTSGMVIPRRRTPLTASPRRCCWPSCKLTARSSGSTA